LVTIVAPFALMAQAPGASAMSGITGVSDLPLAAGERRRFVGVYHVTMPDPGRGPMSLRVFEDNDALMGQFGNNAPSRLLYQGSNVFRPEQAPAFAVTFRVEGGQANRLSIVSPEGAMNGVRIDEARATDGRGARGNPSTSGTLYEDLARMDSILFHAAFVACDLRTIDSLLTGDVEFYHDKTGFESGQQVRDSFQKLAQSCPRDRGVTRELVDGTLQVYPIKDYGAVQMGVHRFVERATPTSTTARFVHLWRRENGKWRLARVLSFDHRPTESP
jgi:hypothetical protein